MRDGVNSLMRYFKNNFYDGFRQDSIDLLLGNYQIKPNEALALENCPVAVENNRRYLAVSFSF